MRICDFYRMDGSRIAYNWMMLDVADFMRSSGRRVLPHSAALPDDGTFLPPRAMDGVPAPLSAYVGGLPASASTKEARRVAHALLVAEWGYHDPNGADMHSAGLWHEHDMVFYGPSGVGLAKGYEQYRRHVRAAHVPVPSDRARVPVPFVARACPCRLVAHNTCLCPRSPPAAHPPGDVRRRGRVG